MSNRRTRRDFMVATAAAGLAAALPLPASARDDDAAAVIDAFTRGSQLLGSGIRLDIAAAVENGAYVSIAIEVDSAMTDADSVDAVLLVAPENPRPAVAEFQFSPASGRARVATRIRLARSQEVIALARMRDGTVRRATQRVTVAVGGCDI